MSGNLPRTRDQIRIQRLALPIRFGDQFRWRALESQQEIVYVTVQISHDCTRAALEDDLYHSINYASICSRLKQTSENKLKTEHKYRNLESLTLEIAESCFLESAVEDLHITVERPDALLHGNSVTYSAKHHRTALFRVDEETLLLKQLAATTIIGVNQEERARKQLATFDVELTKSKITSAAQFNYGDLADVIIEAVERSTFLTLEALCNHVAEVTLAASGPEVASIAALATKPSALASAHGAQVSIQRSRLDYNQSVGPKPSSSPWSTADPVWMEGEKHVATLAFGSNLGDRFANIEHALRLLEDASTLTASGIPTANSTSSKIQVIIVDTSFLYETAPMYVEEQPFFVNGACLIETNLDPLNLLKLVKYIEDAVGRVPSIRNGPRAIDLDIITYDDLTMDTRPDDEQTNLDNLIGQLVVPHPRMLEREFVLRPLNDVIPHWRHPKTRQSMQTHLHALLSSTEQTADQQMYKVLPFPQFIATRTDGLIPYATSTYWKLPVTASSTHPVKKTHIMATLNATPDSFSDGSDHEGVQEALSYAHDAVRNGAHIIDIGGYSTRPSAAFVSEQEEIERVVPVIKAIRSSNLDAGSLEDVNIRNTLISVDTFRPEVATAAIEAGANCINDVYAFAGPGYPLDAASWAHFKTFRDLAAKHRVPVVMMHSRGDAGSHKDYSVYEHAHQSTKGSAVLEAVKVELGERVHAAVRGRGGLRRWQVIVDPGVGFSKTVEDNLQVLRHSARIVQDPLRAAGGPDEPPAANPLFGFPQLIGASRKSFLGTILARPDSSSTYNGRVTQGKERGYATAAAVACAVNQGALVVRVHDVLEMGDVVRIASALWT